MEETKLSMPLVGKKLVDMELDVYAGDEEKKVHLSDYRGKWLVLFFYPADFTFVCPTELEEMAGLYERFRGEDCEVMSVSTDTVYTHKAWHDHSEAIGKIAFPMAADPAGKLSRMLGTYLEDEGVSLRASFIIDPEGVIAAIEVNNNDIGRSAPELLRKLQAAKFGREHNGKVCPASWKPGSDTLEPGMDLVGKI